MKHCMIDLETLAVSPSATILTIGAVIFNPFKTGVIEELYIRVDVDSQEAYNREVDPNTLEWWSKQDPVILEEALNPDNRVPYADAIEQIRKFAWGCKRVWSHGAVFDIIILENCFRELKMSAPWNFYDCRDTRTLFDLADPEMPQASKHNALEDAKRQAIGVQNVYRKLGYNETR